MNTESNPFSAPATTDQNAGRKPPEPKQTPVDFGSVIKTWEILRIAYNLIMGAITIALTLVMYPENLLDLVFWFSVVVGALIANLCFLMGPAIEGYGRYFGLWGRPLTGLLFMAGLMVTFLLAWDCIANYRSLLGMP